MSRASTRLDIDLSTLTAAGAPLSTQQARIFQVMLAPDGMSGVEVNFDDDATWWPVTDTLKMQAPDAGQPYQRVALRGPAQSGILSLFVGDDPVPLRASRGTAAASLARWLDLLWLPHKPQAAGGVLPPDALVKGGAEFLGFLTTGFTAPGIVPQYTVRNGRPCGICLPAGGRSGVFLYHTIPWVRLRADLVSGQAVGDHPDSTHQSWHLEVELAADAAGGTDDVGTGIWLTPSNGTAASDGFPDNAVSPNAFLGIVRNGAGGWLVAARAITGGPLTVADDITAAMNAAGFPAAVRVHLCLMDADPLAALDGRVFVSIAGQLVKSYTDMSKWPVAFANGAPTYCTYRCRIYQHGDNAHALSFANVRLWSSRGQGVAQQ